MGRYVAFAELPEEERAVGQRVRAARTRARLSQAKLAPVVGLTRDQLNNVELGRVALRFEAGWNICLELDINPLWLYSGEGESAGFADMPGTDEIFGDVRFTQIVADLARDDDPHGSYADHREQTLRQRNQKVRADRFSTLEKWFRDIRHEDQPAFLRAIAPAARAFARGQQIHVNQQLTNAREATKVRAMELRKAKFWPRLRSRLQAFVKERGMKSQLARDVGLSRQAINVMLSDNVARSYVPSAEYALRLHEWVTAAEANSKQKKRAGRAETRPALKTRKSKSTSHEKAKSDRSKG